MRKIKESLRRSMIARYSREERETEIKNAEYKRLLWKQNYSE